MGGGPVREKSEVSLRYQIKALPPITRVKTEMMKSRPRQDFMFGGVVAQTAPGIQR